MKYDLTRTTSTRENNITVKPRKLDWDFADVPRRWVGDDIALTSLMNTMSVVAPAFEDWAIPATRAVAEKIQNEYLRKEARAFIGQEAHHSVAHKKFNSEVIVGQHGYDLTRIDGYLKDLIGHVADKPAKYQIAMVMAGEHFLSNMADWYLNDMRNNVDLNAKGDRLFSWHMAEEIEHTAIVYDVFDLVYGESLKNRLLKYITMIKATGLVVSGLYRIWKDFMEQEAAMRGARPELNRGKVFVELSKVSIRYFGRYIAYFLPGFHPWGHNRNVSMLGDLIRFVERESG